RDRLWRLPDRMGRRRHRARSRYDRSKDRRAGRSIHGLAPRHGDCQMSDTDGQVPLPNLDNVAPTPAEDLEAYNPDDHPSRPAADLEAVFDVPVQVSAVLGRSRMQVGELLRLGPGTVLELDRRVGEAIDIYINNRLVARGEVVLVEDKLGVTMTEIIKQERT